MDMALNHTWWGSVSLTLGCVENPFISIVLGLQWTEIILSVSGLSIGQIDLFCTGCVEHPFISIVLGPQWTEIILSVSGLSIGQIHLFSRYLD